MNKIVCEVCGTAYPEASTQCPICGCVRPVNSQGMPSGAERAASERTYQHVKGGRFSKSNVRKRVVSQQSSAHSAPAKSSQPAPKPAQHVQPQQRPHSNAAHAAPRKKKKKSSSNMGLVLTIFALLLAIIAVVVYILVKFFIPSSPSTPELEVTDPIVTEEVLIEEEITDFIGDIPCEELVLDNYELTLESAGDHTYLVAMPEPFDTTDEIVFESENSSIAMVDSDGRVTAVRKGDTVITVTCGAVSVQCRVLIGVPKVVLELDTAEVSLANPGDTVVIYSGSISLSEITWSSDDESVATVDDGVVTAVGEGTTTVYGDYKTDTVSCVVRCKFVAAPTEAGTVSDDTTEAVTEATEAETVPTEPAGTYKGPYKLKNLTNPDNSSDVSIRKGEIFWLELIDSQGKTVKSAKWTVEGDECTVDNGTVKGVKAGDDCFIVVTFDGQTFKCRVRVR